MIFSFPPHNIFSLTIIFTHNLSRREYSLFLSSSLTCLLTSTLLLNYLLGEESSLYLLHITLLLPHIILFTSNYLLLHITFPLSLSSPPHNPFPHIILSFSLSSPPSHDLLLLHTIFSTHISVIWHHPPISSCELAGQYLHANFPV